jgi:two-component system, NtrC family, sensor kinase
MTRKLLFAIFMVAAFGVPCLAQQERYVDVPRLTQQLQAATSDKARILIKTRLAEAYRSNKPDSSLLLANEALFEAIKLKFKKGEARALIALSVLHREKGDLPNALDAGIKAFKIAEAEQLIYDQIFAAIRVANVYLSVKETPKALSYLKSAEHLLTKAYDHFQWLAVQNFLGLAYLQANDLASAEKQADIIEQSPQFDPSGLSGILNMRAGIAVKRGDLPLAIKFYRESNKTARTLSGFREIATNSNEMAIVFRNMGHTDSAIYYARVGLKLGQELGYKNRVLAASSLLAELHAETDPKEAVKYFQIASAANDSLYGVQKVLQMQAGTIREQERLAEEEALRVAGQNKMRQATLLAGVLGSVLLVVILYRNNRLKQRSNNLLNKTLTDLKATQSQLIQAEKMASLGELTAGIAHEIQNPLNFVNNFSEVSGELMEELEQELDMGNVQEAKVISSDIKQNLQKIHHHGQRADAIVKNMLQHSRTTAGEKQLTNLNNLADEYLRLAYHGLRSKDKSFTCTLDTFYDLKLEKVEVVPQDIGRVLLNLFNNAFYAVQQRQKLGQEDYQPTVTVSTHRQEGQQVEIRVRDNGTGMPESVKQKIFQPFFTTKPTGQGTGLGLSLSYDIIKGHGGELQVESVEGEFTEFMVQLPVIQLAHNQPVIL